MASHIALYPVPVYKMIPSTDGSIPSRHPETTRRVNVHVGVGGSFLRHQVLRGKPHQPFGAPAFVVWFAQTKGSHKGLINRQRCPSLFLSYMKFPCRP